VPEVVILLDSVAGAGFDGCTARPLARLSDRDGSSSQHSEMVTTV